MEDAVDKELNRRIGDANGVEYFGEVVGDEAISGPLGEPSESEDNRQTLTVTRGLNQGRPTNGSSNGPVEIDGGLDFFVFELNETILFVSIGVVVGQDLKSFIIPALANIPTRGFGAEPKESKLKDGGDTLEGGRNSPRPRGVDFERAEGTPSGNNSTGVPEGVVKGCQRSAVWGIGQFCDQHGGAILGEGETETDEETGANEHPNALGGGLDDGSDDLPRFMASQ